MARQSLSTLADTTGARPALFVLRVLWQRPWRMLAALSAFIVKDMPLWLLPVFTAEIIDLVASRGPVQDVLKWAVIAALVLVLNYPSNMLFIRNYMTVVRDAAAEIRGLLVERLQTLSIGFHARAHSSIVQTKLIRDVENIELMLQQFVGPLLSAASVLTGAVVMTAVAVPEFLPVYALAVPLSLGLRWALSRRARLRNEKLRREMERLSARVGEMASLIFVTRAHGVEQTAITRVADGADGVRRAGLQLDLLTGRVAGISWMTMQLLGTGCLVLAAVVSLGGILPISTGEVVLLSSYFALLTQGLTQLLMLLPVGARGLESVRSITEILQDDDLETNAGKAPVQAVHGDVRFEAVSYRYSHSTEPALRGVDIHIAPGETVAFVGSSGSGKSTLLNLALGLLHPTRGRVLLDGRDMTGLDLRSARRFISVVPQESVLFDASIRENVAYGADHVTDEDIREALRHANADEFVDALPDGWDTTVGERGARLSGGQRQRLSIARALVRDPRILILDEATSALDPHSEALVKDALSRLMQDRTTLVVAHRLSTIRQADRIVVLEHGEVVEQGAHHDLIERGGPYAHLAREQSSA